MFINLLLILLLADICTQDSKSDGYDGIHIKLIQKCIPFILETLCISFNNSF